MQAVGAVRLRPSRQSWKSCKDSDSEKSNSPSLPALLSSRPFVQMGEILNAAIAASVNVVAFDWPKEE
jgi:hypothetical protein